MTRLATPASHPKDRSTGMPLTHAGIGLDVRKAGTSKQAWRSAATRHAAVPAARRQSLKSGVARRGRHVRPLRSAGRAT